MDEFYPVVVVFYPVSKDFMIYLDRIAENKLINNIFRAVKL
jgi:hypothetical protein